MFSYEVRTLVKSDTRQNTCCHDVIKLIIIKYKNHLIKMQKLRGKIQPHA